VHADLLPGFKNAKHGDQWINTLATYAFPKIGPRPVGEIDVAAVLDVLRPIWNAKEETARRVRQRMDAVMRWAVAHGYATTNPVDAASELLGKQRDKVEHHTAMPLDQIPDFYARLGRSTGMAARCLQFLVLTAIRSGEARGAPARELDLEVGRWTIAAERMKAGVEHVVPLSSQAIELLRPLIKAAQDPTDLVFPSPKGGGLSDMAMTTLMRKMQADGVPHGFRSSFRDWCSREGVSREIAERALAHAVRDKTESAYLRTTLIEERRPVMQAWADFVTGAAVETVPAKGASKKTAA